MMKHNMRAAARRALCAICAVLLVIGMAGGARADSGLRVGSTVQLGYYHNYAISWTVLAVESNRALLISTLALDVQPYNSGSTAQSVTWENCSLRKWLNGSFFSEAFLSSEQEMILTTTLENPGYTNSSGQYISGGNDTSDRIFLLSMDEVKTYFSSNDARKAGYTSYASSQGASAYDSYGACYWWLRSPGLTQDRAACVDVLGYPYRDGSYVNYNCAAVRPAMWVQLGTGGLSNTGDSGTGSNKTVSMTCISGTAGANSREGCGNLFDGDMATKWCVTSFSSAYVIWKASESISPTGYKIATANDTATYTGRNPKTWYLYGSNDSNAAYNADVWKLIVKHEDDSTLKSVNKQIYTFTFTSEVPSYQYYKLYITEITSGNCMQISEFALTYAGGSIEIIDSAGSSGSNSYDYDYDYDYDDDDSSSSKGKEKVKIKCYKCHGDGTIQCSQCDGRGTQTRYVHVPNFSGHSDTSGSVEVTCGKCHGSGSVECPRCDGTGEI